MDGWDYSMGLVFAPDFQVDLYAGLLLNRVEQKDPSKRMADDDDVHIMDIRDRGWFGKIMPIGLVQVKTDMDESSRCKLRILTKLTCTGDTDLYLARQERQNKMVSSESMSK